MSFDIDGHEAIRLGCSLKHPFTTTPSVYLIAIFELRLLALTIGHKDMPRLYLFADESGDFTFNRNHNVSKYFILTTVSMFDCAVGSRLVELRRRLIWEGYELGDMFHATADKQVVRDEVFAVIAEHDFKIQATIMEKSKALPHVRIDNQTFYRYEWYYHFGHAHARRFRSGQEVQVTAEAIGTKKTRATFKASVNNVLQQYLSRKQWAVDFCSATSDPCLQVADYCSWAIQRLWERGDERSYNLIRGRITYEYDLWKRGNDHYY